MSSLIWFLLVNFAKFFCCMTMFYFKDLLWVAFGVPTLINVCCI